MQHSAELLKYLGSIRTGFLPHYYNFMIPRNPTKYNSVFFLQSLCYTVAIFGRRPAFSLLFVLPGGYFYHEKDSFDRHWRNHRFQIHQRGTLPADLFRGTSKLCSHSPEVLRDRHRSAFSISTAPTLTPPSAGSCGSYERKYEYYDGFVIATARITWPTRLPPFPISFRTTETRRHHRRPEAHRPSHHRRPGQSPGQSPFRFP